MRAPLIAACRDLKIGERWARKNRKISLQIIFHAVRQRKSPIGSISVSWRISPRSVSISLDFRFFGLARCVLRAENASWSSSTCTAPTGSNKIPPKGSGRRIDRGVSTGLGGFSLRHL